MSSHRKDAVSDNLSLEDADQLAELLNHICAITLEALLADELTQRLDVAVALREFRAQFGGASVIAPFVLILAEWLEGERPDRRTIRSLDSPFRGALQAMVQQVPDKQGRTPPKPRSAEPAEPISRHVLAQLISTVVAARAAGDEAVQRTLAAQLLNIQTKLEGEWRQRLGPLLENLRRVLGGIDARILPAVPDPIYQRLWMSAVELLINADLSEEHAHQQLMDRLTHNATFVARANNPDLTEGFLRTLLDVQRQALQSDAPAIATLVGAIRAFLQGLDPTPFTLLLQGEERAAWLRILEEGEGSPSSEGTP